MRRTAIRLSDGRELLYFDRDDRPARSGRDSRSLAARRTEASGLRQDPLSGDWVSVADHRQDRIFLPDAAECPLCPTTPGNASEIPAADYDVVVFENRFPSFPAVGADGGGPAGGRCEVVAFTPDHDGSIGELDPSHMALVLDAWIDRTRALSELPGTRGVFVFENRGAEVGVTLHHPHGQVFAYPFVPAVQKRILHRGAEAARRGDRLLAGVVDKELQQGDRIVFADDHWVAFVPYAAGWPYEVQVHPRRDLGSLAELSGDERASLAIAYPRLVRTLDRLFDIRLSYLAGWFQTPGQPTFEETRDSRLFLRLVSNRRSADKLKYLASSESLMGAYILDVSPEAAAESLRIAWAGA